MRHSIQRGIEADGTPTLGAYQPLDAVDLPASTSESATRPDRQSGRMPLVELIAAQEHQSTLQVLENLARANRRIGTLTAVLAAEADKDCSPKASSWRLPFSNRRIPTGFVETGIRSVIRQREVAAMTEPTFRLQESDSIFKRLHVDSAETGFLSSRTKAQMLVDRLLLACRRESQNRSPSSGNERNECTSALALDLDSCLRQAGVSTGTDNTRPAGGSLNEGTGTMDVSVLAELVAARDPDMPHADFIRLIAGHSGAAAQFLNYVDHALLIKNSANNTPCNRYEYTDDFGLLTEQVKNKGEPWLETFLPGVERSLLEKGGPEGAWRILEDGDWRYPNSKREVMDHVFLSAIVHLHLSEPAFRLMPIYPLVAYELLGDAIGRQVPDYLVAHEYGILETLNKNSSDAVARKARQQDDSIKALEARTRTLAFQQQRVQENHVSSASQLYLCRNNYDPKKVTDHSLDRLVPVAPVGGDRLTLVRKIQATLTKSHDRQAVSYVDHISSGRDHLCWLRSGWLSLFSTRTPDQLASRLSAICRPGSQAFDRAPILAEIANRFRTAPATFMHGESAGHELSENLQRPARLGPVGPLETLIPSAALPSTSRSGSQNIEGWLKDLQCDLATCFRFEKKSVMNEIEALGFPGTFASSDMLIHLHRAFQAPCLIIEAGLSETGGEQHAWSSVSAQFHVAALEGTPLATLLNAPEHESPEAALHRATLIFKEFQHVPVIWLEREHYELYFPKSMTRPEHQVPTLVSLPETDDD